MSVSAAKKALMAERTNNNKWYWLTPMLLLLFPSVVVIAWWRCAPPTPTALERSSASQSTLILPPTIAGSHVAADASALAPPEARPPVVALPVALQTATPLAQRPSAPKSRPVPGELSDDAIAAFDSETIAMLNSHKYWSFEKQALVDGLYDQWLNQKQQGDDGENARRQITWALEGRFMENY